MLNLFDISIFKSKLKFDFIQLRVEEFDRSEVLEANAGGVLARMRG